MNKSWTLYVRNLGRIKEASVRIAPLICFVGENNSGKSYLMSILWGILTLGKDLFPKTPSDSKVYKRCEEFLRQNLNEEIKLTNEECNLFVDWFNAILRNNKNYIVKKIFNYDINIDIIEIREYTRKTDFVLKWDDATKRYSAKENYVKIPKINANSITRDNILQMCSYICWNLLMHGIAEPLSTNVVKGRRMGEPVYLPASRTGFMLTYGQLINSSLQNTYTLESTENRTTLTLPYIDFLQLITTFETGRKISVKKQEIVDFIEKNMIEGSLSVRRDMLPVISYQTDDKVVMPLYVSSSIVTEISPLLLLFKSNINFSSLIIEEPEAHLHPVLQKQMARLIIRIANSGIPVWITTHSDSILQHINNMIKLCANRDRDSLSREFGYSKSDIIDYNDVEMYQYEKCEDGQTTLKRLERTEYGFVVPTFNDAIERSIQEVRAFQKKQ